MPWFLFALLGNFLYAFSSAGNKILLRQRATTKPIVFTFYIGILSIFSFVLIPFGNFYWPGLNGFLLDISVGAIFFFSLYFFYKALDVNEASRVAPLTGGLTPIFTLILAFFFLGERLNLWQFLAFLLLVSGCIFISFEKSRTGDWRQMKLRFYIFLTVFSGAVSWILQKYIFETQSFTTGFVWSRIGLALAAFVLLLFPSFRRLIFSPQNQPSQSLGFSLILVKILTGFASLFINLALVSGSASLVNALGGAEYGFLLALTFLLSKKYPQLLKEKTSFPIMAQKISAIAMITGGLAILAIWG
jgi:drug/metabolite transporter (DMT)-like permease